jgi:hypothetical protein
MFGQTNNMNLKIFQCNHNKLQSQVYILIYVIEFFVERN